MLISLFYMNNNNLINKLNQIKNNLENIILNENIIQNIDNKLDNILDEIDEIQYIIDINNENIDDIIINRIDKYKKEREFALKYFTLFHYLYSLDNNYI